ncbi:P-loop containing nucleoside triphosphate hydrolase protein [Backusella circina FSU 941]|nr:P-loop containing nucleoside triphosphate hydrolase protein [Backusella circina FSU 941]
MDDQSVKFSIGCFVVIHDVVHCWTGKHALAKLRNEVSVFGFWIKLLSNFLDIFERFSDDSFWSNILGDRTLSLLKRYLVNDTLHIFIFVTFLPAVMAGIIHGFKYIKRRIEELFYVQIVIGENDLIYTPINEYITKHFKGVEKLSRVRGKTGYTEPQDINKNRYGFYRSSRASLDNTPIIDLIPEKFHVFEIWYKGYKIFISRSEEELSGQMAINRLRFGHPGEATTETIVIKMRSRDLQKLRSFIQEWIDEYYEIRKNKLVIYKCKFQNYGWDDDNYWQEHSYKQKRHFSSVVLKKGDQERILRDIITFKESKDWYDARGIPYRRGYLLWGEPGTGKTSFIQSLASKVKMNVAILNLSAAADDDTLSTVLARVPKNSVLVIEDIDHYKFEEGISEKDDSKKSKDEKKSVSVSGILNAIDGIASLEESIIFMTCNDLNSIPPALIRPGRVDLKLNMSYVDNYQLQLIFWRFFCMEVKETPLEEIPKEKFPLLAKTVTSLLSGLREQAKAVKESTGIAIEISPAELISYFLYHALRFNLPKNPELIDQCFQSLLKSIPEFINSIAVDRKQAIAHAKKKTGNNEDSESNKSSPITPPSSPTAEKKVAETKTN